MEASHRVRRNIVRIRMEKGYTQERLAYESGMSKGFLSEIESGKKSPTIRTLGKIAETLNISLSKLTE